MRLRRWLRRIEGKATKVAKHEKSVDEAQLTTTPPFLYPTVNLRFSPFSTFSTYFSIDDADDDTEESIA